MGRGRGGPAKEGRLSRQKTIIQIRIRISSIKISKISYILKGRMENCNYSSTAQAST